MLVKRSTCVKSGGQAVMPAKTVTFREPDPVSDIIYEDPDIAEDLRLSRTSDWQRRYLDKMRMEDLLKPVFDLARRASVYKRLRNLEAVQSDK